MGLITVWFPAPLKASGYFKAIIDEVDKEFFINLGAYTDQDKAVRIAENAICVPTEQPVMPGDKGDGEPGTLEWHKNQISGMDSKREIIEYTEAVMGKTQRMLRTRAGLEKTREKALELLTNHERDSQHDHT